MHNKLQMFQDLCGKIRRMFKAINMYIIEITLYKIMAVSTLYTPFRTGL